MSRRTRARLGSLQHLPQGGLLHRRGDPAAGSRARPGRPRPRVTVATPPERALGRRLAAAGLGHVRDPDAARLGPARGVASGAGDPRSREIQVAHAHKGRARTLALLAGLMGARSKLVLNRGVSFPVPRMRRVGYTSRRVHAIVAVCESIKRDLVATGVPAEKIEVIYSGTDVGASIPASTAGRSAASSAWRAEHFLITQIGVRSWRGWTRRARGDDAGRAAGAPRAPALRRGAAAPHRGARRAGARARGLGGRVLVLGHREDVPQILAASRRRASTPPTPAPGSPARSARRSPASGPWSATDLAGMPELVLDGETGLLVAPARSRRAGPAPSVRCSRIPTAAPDDGAGRPQARRRALLAPRQARRAPRRSTAAWSSRARHERAHVRLSTAACWPYLRPYVPALIARHGARARRRRDGGLDRLARQARARRRLHPARRAHAEAHPAAAPGRLHRQGSGPLRPVLPDGVGRRARDRRASAATLYTHIQRMSLSFFASLHSAELMSRVVTDVNRLARAVLDGAGHGDPPDGAWSWRSLIVMFVREWRLAVIALVVFPFVGVAVRVDRPPALPHQQAVAGEGRRAERAPARGVLGHQDRQGVRARGATRSSASIGVNRRAALARRSRTTAPTRSPSR